MGEALVPFKCQSVVGRVGIALEFEDAAERRNQAGGWVLVVSERRSGLAGNDRGGRRGCVDDVDVTGALQVNAVHAGVRDGHRGVSSDLIFDRCVVLLDIRLLIVARKQQNGGRR